ncbi:hypothetical protein Tco_1495518 [Tanacetum coccineum]
MPFSQGIGAGGSPRCQEDTGGSTAQTRSERVPTQAYDSPLPRVNTLGSDEGSMQLQELMALCTKLSDKVKKLENTVKSNQARRRAKIVVSDDEEDLEDSSKQGRMIEEIDQDARVTLVTPTHSQQDQPEDQLGVFSAAKVNINIPSPIVVKDNGKCIITEYEPEQTKTKLQQRQERAGYEAAIRLQEQLDEEERQRITKVHKEASSLNIEEWEDIQATIEADEELAQRIQAEEREKYSEAEKARLLTELINQRKKYFTQQRAEERRNKPFTQAQ